MPELPKRMSSREQRTFGHHLSSPTGPVSSHRIDFPFDTDELKELLGSAEGILRTETSNLPLTIEQVRQIEESTRDTEALNVDLYDRLLIFVDGSSDPAHRHHDIEFVNEYGKSDAWAYAVVGEKYGDASDSQLTLLRSPQQKVGF